MASMGDDGYTDRILLENLKERDPHGRPSLEWDDNIKMDVREVNGMA